MPAIQTQDPMPDSVLPLDPDAENDKITNLTQTSVDRVSAELVRMHQSAARQVTTEEIELRQSAAYRIESGKIESNQSALGILNATEVSLANSGVAAIRAQSVSLQGAVGIVIAGNVSLTDTYSGIVAGRDVQGERIETLVLFANHVNGEVHTIMDARSALIMGMVGGLFGGLVFMLARLAFKRE